MQNSMALQWSDEIGQVDADAQDTAMLQASLVGSDDDWLPGMSDGDFCRPISIDSLA